jgi:hypothetical protein
VAEKFGISVRTVERHGRESAWARRLGEINRRAAAKTDARLGEAKAVQVGRLRTLIEATLVGYAEKLRRGDMRFSPGDLDKLYKLWRQLDDELDQPTLPTGEAPPAMVTRTVEQNVAVVEALAESGALTLLGLQKIAPAAVPDPDADSDAIDATNVDDEAVSDE